MEVRASMVLMHTSAYVEMAGKELDVKRVSYL